MAAKRTQLPRPCVNLHDLTPCLKEFVADSFFAVAVPRKPYYNPVNLEKARTHVKQKEFVRRICQTRGTPPFAHQRSGAPPGHFFLGAARLGGAGAGDSA